MLLLAAAALQPAPRPPRPLRTACACRPHVRVRNGRLVLAVAGTPPPGRERPPAPPLGAPSLRAWALSAPDAAVRAYTLLRGKLAAAYEVRRSSSCPALGVEVPALVPRLTDHRLASRQAPLTLSLILPTAADARQVGTDCRASMAGRPRHVGGQQDVGRLRGYCAAQGGHCGAQGGHCAVQAEISRVTEAC